MDPWLAILIAAAVSIPTSIVANVLTQPLQHRMRARLDARRSRSAQQREAEEAHAAWLSRDVRYLILDLVGRLANLLILALVVVVTGVGILLTVFLPNAVSVWAQLVISVLFFVSLYRFLARFTELAEVRTRVNRWVLEPESGHPDTT